jgi:hypothetical protein
MCIAQRAKSSMPPYTIGIKGRFFILITSNCCVRTSVSKWKRRTLFFFIKLFFLPVKVDHSYFIMCPKKTTDIV